jgi:hypothetical protein
MANKIKPVSNLDKARQSAIKAKEAIYKALIDVIVLQGDGELPNLDPLQKQQMLDSFYSVKVTINLAMKDIDEAIQILETGKRSN